MTEDALCRFARELGLRKPYFVTDWNGYKVYDTPQSHAIIDDPEESLVEEEDIHAPDEDPPFILVRGDEIRLTSPAECRDIIAFLPPEESCCEDFDEDLDDE